jgi:hypothetical protein
MADEKPEKSVAELLEELAKRLPKEEASLGSIGSSVFGTTTNWLEALGYLTKEAKAAAQKRAAETNLVDNAAANAWLKEHWTKPRKCAVCSKETWGLSPNFAHLPESLVGLHQAVRTIPLVVLTCRTCGNTLFLNAIVMGLLPQGAQ